jgi:hypothetical protein
MTDPRLPSEKGPGPQVERGSFEDLQRALDPHRDEERQGVEQEVAARLRGRGVELTGRESPSEMADLLDAVDQFESAVEAQGGDLFIDTPTARHRSRVEQPDDPAYVLPARRSDETVASYIDRIAEATERLR